MAIPTRAEYETLVYALPQTYSEHIRASTLRLYSTSALTARLDGEIQFTNKVRLRVVEFIDFKAQQIRNYSYTVFYGDERIRWYDAQPHPELPQLASTFPHHRHEPPDIKHHRLPALGISFHTPNLATLIADCIELGNSLQATESTNAPQGDPA